MSRIRFFLGRFGGAVAAGEDFMVHLRSFIPLAAGCVLLIITFGKKSGLDDGGVQAWETVDVRIDELIVLLREPLHSVASFHLGIRHP